MVKEIYLCRHGQTEWSKLGQHTSVTDLDLIPEGIEQAKKLANYLKGKEFNAVFSSPLKRAMQTAEIVGFPYEIDEDLFEWRYGEYEGLTTKEIREKVPNWDIFDFPLPGGETVEEIETRAKRLFEKLYAVEGRVLLFSSAHISRALASTWIGLSPRYGKHFQCSTASCSILAYERESPTILSWNISP
ncbi:MAG: Acid phosphatase [Chlamydiales bacterium]|nr:Acid phosphatase [Chlamydiales bacterium]MCH9619195.1 Acid phosphatase [Chlamydiales bacterium]MCH9622457.1 Acid phosphatase [Chlamydiales bacterium]